MVSNDTVNSAVFVLTNHILNEVCFDFVLSSASAMLVLVLLLLHENEREETYWAINYLYSATLGYTGNWRMNYTYSVQHYVSCNCECVR